MCTQGAVGVLVALCASAVCADSSSAGRRPLTVADAIETVRFMTPQTSSGGRQGGEVSISPDASRYVVRLVRGDVARDGAAMELLVGGLSSLKDAQRLVTVARMFTTGRGSGQGPEGPDRDVSGELNPLHWIDDRHVAFLWSDDRGIRQVVRIDLDSRKVEYLTHQPTHVTRFDISKDGTLLFNSKAPANRGRSEQLLQEGYVIAADADPFNIFRGDIDGSSTYDRLWNTHWFVSTADAPEPRPIEVAGRAINLQIATSIYLSPDGRSALVTATPPRFEEEWGRYTRRVIADFVGEARRDPLSQPARALQQFFVLDIPSGRSRPLWNALSAGTVAEWSPDGRHVLLAPTFLPLERADAVGLEGRAAVIVDVGTGSYEQLPVDVGWGWVSALHWMAPDEVEIVESLGRRVEKGQFRTRFRRGGERWVEAGAGGAHDESPRAAVRMEVRDDFNTPPRLFAVEKRSGRQVLVLDPNPGLIRRYSLGRVEQLSGDLSNGDKWRGVLFYPAHYVAGRSYPLVIQSVYGDENAKGFTLYGAGTLGPPSIAAYPGQVLASREFAVLQLTTTSKVMGSPEEARLRQMAFEEVAQHFIATGLANRTKIGLVGFSRNGFYVEYTLTHSSFPFAAAISADNWDPSYFQQTLLGYPAPAVAVNGKPPFGDGLSAWIEHAPGFNVEHVRVPLRMVEQSNGLYGVFGKWEIFGRLRYLAKPVEFYVMPDAEHGAHNTQNPRQIIAVMEGTVDWFEFWLNGREDPDPVKAPQYERWRRLRELHAADLAKNENSRQMSSDPTGL